jgi:type II secretory pathway pseudopilin PulG
MKSIRARNGQGGFTLVETSIVLMTIGMIVGAVSIGINVHRSAEIQKIKSKFIDGWAQAYNEYYTRTGVVVGDNPAEPTYMVAGIDYAYTYTNGDTSGIPLDGNSASNNFDLTSITKICEGQGATDYGTEGSASFTVDGGTATYALSSQRLHELMDRHGIRMPAGRAEGQEDRYVYLDNNGNPQELQICFQWNPATTTHGSGNSMIIRGLTPDLARQLDSMVDGKADAREGRFRQFYASTEDDATEQDAGAEWTGVNSISQSLGDSMAEGDIDATGFASVLTGTSVVGFSADDYNTQGYTTGAAVEFGVEGTIRDEDQVMRVTAVYLMDM